MGVEDILLEAAAEHENEYEDEFEEDLEGRGEGEMSMSLKKAHELVNMEDEFDARESLKSASRTQQEPVAVVSSSLRDDYDDVNHDESIEDKMRKADAKTHMVPTSDEKTIEKVEDTESEYESDEDDTDYEDSKDFLFCCCRRRIDEVYRHLERGANICATDRHGWTPLHWVCAKGYSDILEVLLKEYRGMSENDNLMGFTPLHLACVGAHIECIKILFDHNAKRLKNNIGELPIDVLSVTRTSVAGRKIAMLFGIEVEDRDDVQPQEAKRASDGSGRRSISGRRK